MPGIVGPLKEYALADGTKVPLYVIKFDKRGNCTTPRSQQHLFDALSAGGFTDLYLFSHGWNNTPKDAIKHYKDWVEGYTHLRQSTGVELGRDYKPVLVGVIWPSVWLVPWWERGPKIAAAGAAAASQDDAGGSAFEDMLTALADELPEQSQQRFYDLAHQEQVNEAQARELLALAFPIFSVADDEVAGQPLPSIDDLLQSWDAIEAASEPVSDEFVPEDFDAPVGAPANTVAPGQPAAAGVGDAAGSVVRAPISLIRGASVWQMKDRAGKVGRRGIAVMLRKALALTSAAKVRTHLVGHSFGAKVMLSAICSADQGPLPRAVDSLLLLQPAINHYAFANKLPHVDQPGGYHMALEHVRQPILTTFTNKDKPLRWFFHLGLRRNEDIGELRMASDEAPSRFAAMGGYGPSNLADSQVVAIAEPGTGYPLDGGSEVIALRAHETIDGHSDVSQPATYWALLDLVRSS